MSDDKSTINQLKDEERIKIDIPVDEEGTEKSTGSADVTEEFKRLGRQFGDALESIFNSEEARRVETEVRAGMKSFAEEVEKLEKKNVAIGKVFVIGAEGFSWFDGAPDQPKVDRSRAPRIAAKLGLGSGTAVGKPQELLKNLHIQYSPTWVVRYQGKDYIYEGLGSISRYFSSQGQFLGAQK